MVGDKLVLITAPRTTLSSARNNSSILARLEGLHVNEIDSESSSIKVEGLAIKSLSISTT